MKITNKNKSVDIFNALIDELTLIKLLPENADSSAINRLKTRSIFSLLDAFSNSLKLEALKSYNYNKEIFSEIEVCFLKEGKYIEGVWKPYMPGIRDNIKKSLKLFAKSRNTQTPLLKDVPLPPEFSIALLVRTNVTHPKCLDDLIISNTKMTPVLSVLEWISKLFVWTRYQEIIYINTIKENINNVIDSSIENIKNSVKNNNNTNK